MAGFEVITEAVRPLPDVLNHQAHKWFVRDGDVQPVNTAEHRNDFLDRLHGATLLRLKEIIRARNRRRTELRTIVRDRQQAVDTLLEIKRGEVTETIEDGTDRKPPSPARPPAPALKRYRNE